MHRACINVHLARMSDNDDPGKRHTEERSKSYGSGRRISVDLSTCKIPKSRKSGLTSGVARKRIECVDMTKTRVKETKNNGVTNRYRQVPTRRSFFAMTNAGASRTRHWERTAATKNVIQQNNKLSRQRDTFLVGRTVCTEERGRQSNGFVAKVGQCLGRTVRKAGGSSAWVDATKLAEQAGTPRQGETYSGRTGHEQRLCANNYRVKREAWLSAASTGE